MTVIAFGKLWGGTTDNLKGASAVFLTISFVKQTKKGGNNSQKVDSYNIWWGK